MNSGNIVVGLLVVHSSMWGSQIVFLVVGNHKTCATEQMKSWLPGWTSGCTGKRKIFLLQCAAQRPCLGLLRGKGNGCAWGDRIQCAAFPFHQGHPMQLCLWMCHECKKSNGLKITWTLNIQYFTINSVMTECKMESFVTVGQLIANDSVASFSRLWRDYWKTIFLKYSLAPAWLLTHPMKHLFSLVGVSKAEPSGRMPAHAAWITFHTLHPV